MTLALLFYICLLLWLITLFWSPHPWAPGILLFLMLLALGWHAFGAPIKG